MRAIVKKEGKRGVSFEEVPTPKIKDNEVLIKIHKSSICGTDLHIYNWDTWAQKNVPIGTTIGHEFTGNIIALGKNVNEYKVGDRVSGEGHITCGTCARCKKDQRHLCINTKVIGIHRNGAFAEYLSLPAENVFLLSPKIPDDIASIFDPFGNATHTALSFPLKGEDVLITGAGPIGIMAAAIARHSGARNVVITDINEYRLNLAQKLGASLVVNVNKVSLNDVTDALNLDGGFTVGLEMSGNASAFRSLLEKMQPGGKVALLGILPHDTVIDWDKVIFKMLEIKGIYGREIFRTWDQMTTLLEEGLNLMPVITHHFKAEDFEKGFDAMFSGNCGKVILEW